MSTSRLFPSSVPTAVLTGIFAFLATSNLLAAETQRDEGESLDFIQRFDHPIVSEGSSFDPAPFQPPQQNLVGFPGVRLLCKCGIQNGKNAPKQIEREDSAFGISDLSVVGEKGLIWNASSSVSGGIVGADIRQIPHDFFVSKGVEAEINEYPWIVALIYNLSNGTQVHFCGGTLFSNKYILTATHCLAGKNAAKTEVWLNEHDILLSTETPGGTLQIKAKRFIIHPKYNSIMHYNDISLIELTEEVDINRSIFRPLCLPSPNFDPTTSSSAVEGVAAGWGQTFFHGPKSAKLLKVSLPILSHDSCITKSEPFYKKRVTDHMICAGDIAIGGRDTCPGDSGGPLFVNQRGKHILVGIVSWGYRCGEPKKPGVYTRVSKYIGWINQETSTGQRCAG